MANYKKMTVNDLISLLKNALHDGSITDNTEVWLSSDEEGNSYSPLVQLNDGTFNIGFERQRDKITFYPISS